MSNPFKNKTMKKNIFLVVFASLLSLGFIACGSDDAKDETAPVITDAGITANPINCQVYHRGDVIPFHYIFTDDMELGSFNIEIHNNWDHHSHSTESNEEHEHEHESVECEEHDHDHEDETHAGGTAWVFNQSYEIPAENPTYYEANFNIQIPEDIGTGDYHFMIRVVDKAGWQQLKAIAIEIEE